MKKKSIIIIVIVACISIGIIFVIKYDLVRKIENKIYLQKIKNEILTEDNEKYTDEPELVTETFADEDGNEIVVKMKNIVIKDAN
jgi:acyl-coenzyme A synthetase/AMP-(fatty) acid ligase